MDIFSDIAAPIIATVVSAAVVAFFTAIYRLLKKADRDRKKAERERQEAELRQQEINEKLAEGVRANLHDRLKQACKYHIKLGHCTVSDRTNIKYMFDAYVNLDGNSIIEDLYKRAKDLPIFEEEE